MYRGELFNQIGKWCQSGLKNSDTNNGDSLSVHQGFTAGCRN